MSRPWTEQEIALMLHLEEHGERGERLSTNQIAKLLHRTAKHVADKLHDHGRRAGKGSNLSKDWKPRAKLDHEHLAGEAESCRWVEGDPRELRYCPDEKKPRSDYCPHHHGRAYAPAEGIRNLDALANWCAA